MQHHIIGHSIIPLEKADSSNSYATAQIKNDSFPEGTVIWVKHQYAGRGQNQNTWESEKDKNITISVILHPTFLPINKSFILNKAISLGVADFVRSNAKEKVSIKWPNDIYVGDKKIAGILIENAIISNKFQHSIIGIGININQTNFITNPPNPTSLKLITKKIFPLNKCLEELCNFLQQRYAQLKQKDYSAIVSEYLDTLYQYNQFKKYRIKNKIITAKIIDITDTGVLLLETKEHEKIECSTKEIKFI